MRKDIEFKTDDGVMLRGWFYTPEGAGKPAPTIVMAHGYSAFEPTHRRPPLSLSRLGSRR